MRAFLPVHPSGLTACCVYATLPTDQLASALETGCGEFTEPRRWIGALEILNRNRKRGLRLPVVFAHREETDGIRYRALIEELLIPTPESTTHGTTTVRFSALRRLSRQRPLDALRLKSTGLPLGPDFDRPYAICLTPEFLVKYERL